MKRSLSVIATTALLIVCAVGTAAAQQEPRRGTVVVPPSNVEFPGDVGVRAHTNFLIFVPAARSNKGGIQPGFTGTSPSGETPASLSCVYGTWAGPGDAAGCLIGGSGYKTPSGGTKVIAIVDAYHYPTACNDFNHFSTQFGLPTANCSDPNDPHFRVVYASGSQPRANCGWAQEAALDIEWAHAMAPDAQIILVEADSNSNTNLLKAVDVASGLVAQAGGGLVSMSWGSSEFSTESTYESRFSTPGVTYIASSGDSGGKVIWPSASPSVVSAGGTTVNRNSSGAFTNETAWSSAGGGPSKYLLAGSYQSSIVLLDQLLNGYRGTPDYSFDANPSTGVSVYDSTSCQGMSGWMVFGGTSVSAPSLAGIINLSGNFAGTSSVQNSAYDHYSTASSGGNVCSYSSPFNDVTAGSAGTYPATGCWDFATGIGSPRGVTEFTGSGGTATPDFSISASPSSRTVTAGSGTTYTVSITSLNGYNGTVNLGTNALPNGVSAYFTPSSLSGSGNSTLSVGTSSATAAGTYTITITGTDSTGSPAHSTTVTLVVNGQTTGDFSIEALPTSQRVSRKGSASYTITVTSQSSFSGSVALSVSEAIPQSRANFSVNPLTVSSGSSATSTLTISTGPKSTGGPYTITITGTSGSLSHSVNVTLTVE